MQDKNGIKAFLEDYKMQIHTEAARLSPLSMPEVTEELFSLFERTGNRLIYENVYFARRKFLTVIGLQALLEKKEKAVVTADTLQKLTEVIEDVCTEECWALPAHVNRKFTNWQLTVDLFASETGQTLSELADRLCDQLPKETYRLITENVHHRIFQPFLQTERFGWEKSGHNWNAVCAGSIGSAALHLLRSQKKLLNAILRRVCDSLLYYIGGFAEDGTCMEGLGYFTYGMSYFVNFALELYEYTSGITNLLCGDWAGFHAGEQDKRTRIAGFWSKCFFADGKTVNFSDGSSREKYHMGLSCALKRHFPSVRMPQISQAAGLHDDNCYRFVSRKLDVFETEHYLEQTLSDYSKQELPGFYPLPDAQWCIANAKSKTGFACKGGHNDEPHNHNDIGHFIYEKDGITLFADLGAGEYVKEYFSSGRYRILCNNSFGHSVPVIAGEGQMLGKEYKCSEFSVKEDSDICAVNMEISGAYKPGILKKIYRQFCFSMIDGRLSVQDQFEILAGFRTAITENLITQIKPQIQGANVILKEGTVQAMLSIEGTNAEHDVRIQEYSHSNHSGEQETVYAIQWDVNVKKCIGCCRFTIETENILTEKMQ